MDDGRPRHRIPLALTLIGAAIAANAAFTGLASTFDYPDVLQHPGAQVLAEFRHQQTAVSAWFVLLALSAAAMAPIAVGVGRLGNHSALRLSVPAGVLAAVVQVVGLSRWPLLVPGWADQAADGGAAAAQAVQSFETASRVLGSWIGETGGYLFTATWTALVVIGLGSPLADRGLLRSRAARATFTAAGFGAAVLVLAGVLVPLDVPGTDMANFIGYVLWSCWLIWLGALFLRRPQVTSDAKQVITV